MKLAILGLSITSSWGNGHATTYRSLVRALAERGHQVVFLERDVPWYASNRDMPQPQGCCVQLYSSLEELKSRYAAHVRQADLIIVGSYVPEGVAVGEWAIRTAKAPVAFYDIDTPVTLAKLERDDEEYLTRALVARYDLYLSFTGGPTLSRLKKQYGSPNPRVFYCSADSTKYFPEAHKMRWQMGYLGTYSEDRQPTVNELLVRPALTAKEEAFVVAGPMYPEDLEWPANVERIDHVPPGEHRAFYNSQRWTLNVTRADMISAGWSPSVRLFEAGACATPVITDYWEGLGDLFEIGSEILVARSSADVVRALRETTEEERIAIGDRLRQRVLAEHTAEARARQLESYVAECVGSALPVAHFS
jgi:spore maturation protein CgeB